MRRGGLYVVVMVALVTAAPVAQADNAVGGESLPIPDVARPQIDDPMIDAELEDLRALASQQGTSLQAAIDRYAWNDNFAITVSEVREASPDAFTGAEIVDGGGAWVAFAAGAPERALEIIDTFKKSHATVTVEVRTDLGFTEVELEKAIETVHYAMFESANVRDVSTSFDFDTRQITAVVALDSDASDSALDDLRADATKKLVDSGLEGILDSIAISVVRSNLPALGGSDSNTEHLGGESLSGVCTSGFVVVTPSAVRGISTAGHCSNSLSDDGIALTIRAGHIGAQGDFQWHTGPQAKPDDFYAGNANATEVNRRDVAAVGAPVVGQSLCKNGIASFQDCQEVIQLNVCNGAACSLVQMAARLAAPGDSGGSVYWGNAAYGLHQGWRYDPFWPFDRDLFSRADRIDDALGVSVAST